MSPGRDEQGRYVTTVHEELSGEEDALDVLDQDDPEGDAQDVPPWS